MTEEKHDRSQLVKNLFDIVTAEKGDSAKKKYEKAIAIIEELAENKDVAKKESLKSLFKEKYELVSDSAPPPPQRTLLQCVVTSGSEKVRTFQNIIFYLKSEGLDNKEIMDILSEPDSDGNSVVHYLAQYGRTKDRKILDFLYAEDLLSENILHMRNAENKTPFYLAYGRGNYLVYEFLLTPGERKAFKAKKLLSLDMGAHGDYLKGREAFRKKNKEGKAAGRKGTFNWKNIVSAILQLIAAVVGVVAVAKLSDAVAYGISGIAAFVFLVLLGFTLWECLDANNEYKKAREPYGTYKSASGEYPKFVLMVLGILASAVLEFLGLFLPIGEVVASAFVAAAPLAVAVTVGLITSHLQTKTNYYHNLFVEETLGLVRKQKVEKKHIEKDEKKKPTPSGSPYKDPRLSGPSADSNDVGNTGVTTSVVPTLVPSSTTVGTIAEDPRKDDSVQFHVLSNSSALSSNTSAGSGQRSTLTSPLSAPPRSLQAIQGSQPPPPPPPSQPVSVQLGSVVQGSTQVATKNF